MLKLLAIDTTTDACVVALMIDETIWQRSLIANKQQAQLILPMIADLLADAGIELTELNAIAFACGPGSFTGIRIAASVSQGLAFAANLPVIAISSLRIFAQTAYENFAAKKVLVATNAHMQEIYWGAYKLDDQVCMQSIMADRLVNPAEKINIIESGWYGVGEGWEVYREILLSHYKHQLSNIASDIYPQASALLKLAKVEYQQKNYVAAENAQPIYLRGASAWQKLAEQKKI